MCVLIGNFEKNLEKVPRSCFVGVAWKFCTPKRYQFWDNIKVSCFANIYWHHISSQYIKRCSKSSCCGPFEVEHPIRGTKTTFLTTNRFGEQPVLYVWEFLPIPPPIPGPNMCCNKQVAIIVLWAVDRKRALSSAMEYSQFNFLPSICTCFVISLVVWIAQACYKGFCYTGVCYMKILFQIHTSHCNFEWPINGTIHCL